MSIEEFGQNLVNLAGKAILSKTDHQEVRNLICLLNMSHDVGLYRTQNRNDYARYNKERSCSNYR